MISVQCKSRLKAAEDELKVLREVPTPSTDIEQRIKCYCTEMARPKIYAIDKQGGKLEVIWPENNLVSMLALFHGDAMAAVLKAEVERISNDPMPLEARRERIAELRREIDGLQRLAFALGADASDLPAGRSAWREGYASKACRTSRNCGYETSERAAVERSALVSPCLTSSTGALPRLLSIKSGRGGPAAGDRE